MSINRTLLEYQFASLNFDPNEKAMIISKIRGDDFIFPEQLIHDLRLEFHNNQIALNALDALEQIIQEEQ